MALKRTLLEQAAKDIGIATRVPRLVDFAMDARRSRLLREKELRDLDRAPNTVDNLYGREREILTQRRFSTDLTPMGTLDKAPKEPRAIIKDSVIILDIDAEGMDNGINKIILPFIPRELKWSPESNFVAIKPVGRNNAKYQYTGSEDILEFEIDWHSLDINRDDVIRNCRQIEALSKADGYNNPPHRVMLKWGEEDVLFRDMVFLVTSAPYRLTQFNKAQVTNNNLVRTAMLPIQAYQKVRLARITSTNLSTKDIQLVQSTKYY